MASRTVQLITAAMVVVVAGTLLPVTASAADYRAPALYRIGDDSGWNVGVDYNAWASSKDIRSGDSIEFVYSAGSHNVVVVDEASYEACTVPSDAVTLTSGDDYEMLGPIGPQYYISSFEGDCQSGMKLAINVRPY